MSDVTVGKAPIDAAPSDAQSAAEGIDRDLADYNYGEVYYREIEKTIARPLADDERRIVSVTANAIARDLY